MTVNEMAEQIIARYGPIIRGRNVTSMSNEQICAIYKSIMKREQEVAKPAAIKEEKCINCGWYSGGICKLFNHNKTINSPACRRYYDDKRKTSHQFTLFE